MENSFLLTVIASLPLSVYAFADNEATGIIKERMDNFKASQMALKQILAASKRNDFEAIVPLANQIKNWAEIMPTKFPSGSDGTPSEADPAIWTDFEGLKSAVKENFGAARFLEVTALNGDTKATAKAIKQLAGICKAYNQSYRSNLSLMG